ncbi:MAG: glycosyltransferase [Candidatus Scalinduaceae bacterium]
MDNKLKKGETLFADGKIEEAEDYFLSLVENDSNNKEAFNNLGVIAFQKNDVKRAVDYFTRSLEIDHLYKDAILNYTDLLRTIKQPQIAVPLLEKIIEMDPNDKEIHQLLEDICPISQPLPKIAVLCLPGLESFLGDIVNFLKTKYEVLTCYSANSQEIESAVRWADIVWLEWANQLAIDLTNHISILDGKRVICRLHRYEALAGFIQKIKWERINDLIFVAEHIRDISIRQVPKLPQLVNNIHVIPNGVNMDKFNFKQRKKGWNIAYIGYIQYRKGPLLLLHTFQQLVLIDKRYRLFVAGKFQDVHYELYFNQMIQEMGLGENIKFDGWIKNQDISAWIEDKQYVICTSIHEGHPVGLMEAMACGLKPLIHNYVGARESYPGKYIWNTIPEFINMVTEDNYDSMEYRKFIETHYSLEIQLERMDKIISRVSEGNITRDQLVKIQAVN